MKKLTKAEYVVRLTNKSHSTVDALALNPHPQKLSHKVKTAFNDGSYNTCWKEIRKKLLLLPTSEIKNNGSSRPKTRVLN